VNAVFTDLSRNAGKEAEKELRFVGWIARRRGINRKTLQKLARRGEVHGSHVGKMWRFRASDLNAWLDRQQRAS
jgi:excisionase family DNA binding protein